MQKLDYLDGNNAGPIINLKKWNHGVAANDEVFLTSKLIFLITETFLLDNFESFFVR